MTDYHVSTVRTPINEDNEIQYNHREEIVHHNTYYLSNNNVREFVSETSGMFWFILFSLGNIANVVLYPESGMTWLGVALSWGFNLMFGIYLASFNSQAHLNPCVSLCFYLFDKSITLTQLVIHSVAQLVGAFLAASVVYGIYYDKISLLKDDKTASSIFATYKANDVHTGCAFFTEFLGTGLLVSGIFAILTNSKTKDHAPVFIGILLSSIVLAFGYQTAFALNPARDLGPRIFTACVGYDSFVYVDHYWWIPLVADYLGAIVFTYLFHILVKYQIV
jgi:MIP family channel proteins